MNLRFSLKVPYKKGENQQFGPSEALGKFRVLVIRTVLNDGYGLTWARGFGLGL
jgi:hypothetical protein